MTRALAIILITLACGCGPAEKVVNFAEAASEYVALTEPILRGAHDTELAACHLEPTAEQDIICQERVNAHWDPILEAMGEVHKAYCAIDAERCGP